MKEKILYSLLFMLTVACSEKQGLETEARFPTTVIAGKEYLDLEKSSYYPKSWKSFEEIDKPFGLLKVNSVDGEKIITAKIWMIDSTFRHLAEQEDLIYSKTYFLDTTYKESISNWEKRFVVKSASNDTAVFQVKMKELNQSMKELKKKWSLRIDCHFEDKNGVSYDTVFYSRFDESWMKE